MDNDKVHFALPEEIVARTDDGVSVLYCVTLMQKRLAEVVEVFADNLENLHACVKESSKCTF